MSDVDVRCDSKEYSHVFTSSVDFLPTTVTKGGKTVAYLQSLCDSRVQLSVSLLSDSISNIRSAINS